ncbi:MAG: extracellular solute-binding protein [Pseudomonadota bacterium]
MTIVSPAFAEKRHGISIFGQLKYPPDFKHFDYVNPNAPKGGEISTYAGPSFDTFNAFILKGDKAAGLNLLYDSLLAGSDDELSSAYGLVAETVEVAEDKMSATFYMRPEARFSDGSAITADDVVFTFNMLKREGHPQYRFLLRDIIKAEALDRLTVRYSFQGDLVRDLPLIVGGLSILSKAYFDTHDFTKTTLKEAPVGSGPYLLVDHKPGDFVTYRRRDDYWAKNLPVNVGRYNFDNISFKYAKDRSASFIAFTAGEYSLREEFTSKKWATEYNFPAVKDGRVKLLTLPDKNPSGTQGWFLNTRREKFSDPRVRRAIGFAFDFEWSNKNLFFDLYKRTESYFENSDMKAVGKPNAAELELLTPFKDQLPEIVFAKVETPPVSDSSGRDRKLLRQADSLLREAGWKLDKRKRVNAAGEQLSFEFIRVEPAFDRIVLPFIKNLRDLGIDASLRPVDAAQYERRLKSFDYDIAIQRYVMSKTPGIELRSYFSSQTADVQGSRNLSGIKNPVVDALIDKIISANSGMELKTAVMALDRVLRAYNYWVPHWYKGAHNIAYWDQFGRPNVKPLYSRGIIDTWWYDAAKAAKLNR